MSTAPFEITAICASRVAVPYQPAELFPDSIQQVFSDLQSIAENDELYEPGEARPSAQNVQWAMKVLLRVLPRHYLVGAEIDTFKGEIHVSWEHNNKRVVAYLPAPNQLKLYYERVTGEVVEHRLQTSNNPWEISGVLRWLFE